MKILIAHNAYQLSGGEDTAVEAEIALLRSYGHTVEAYFRHNNELNGMPRAAAAVSAIWSQRSANDIAHLCDMFHPDVIHVHNTFPLISPSIAWMASTKGIPIIQTLHNFRLICPQAMFLRNGHVCEDCLGKFPWRAITRKCYRDSTMQSAVAAGVLVTHRALKTYDEKITFYIALSEFCRDKFIASGLPAERFRVKPHFVPTQPTPSWTKRRGGLFVGRLSAEKGLTVLIDAVRTSGAASIQIIGTGPLDILVKQTFTDNYLGFKPREQVLEILRTAQFLVAPSTCYETFGLSIIEAFSCGTPVIASRHGSYAELVQDGINGLLFTPGDAHDLAEKIRWAESHPEQMQKMGQAAHQTYEAKYTPQHNYDMLIEIYEDAIETDYKERQFA